MKGKYSNDNPAPSGTHLPRDTHKLEILAGSIRGAGSESDVCRCPPPREQGTLNKSSLPLGPIWWSQHGAAGSFPLLGAFPISRHWP